MLAVETALRPQSDVSAGDTGVLVRDQKLSRRTVALHGQTAGHREPALATAASGASATEMRVMAEFHYPRRHCP